MTTEQLLGLLLVASIVAHLISGWQNYRLFHMMLRVLGPQLRHQRASQPMPSLQWHGQHRETEEVPSA